MRKIQGRSFGLRSLPLLAACAAAGLPGCGGGHEPPTPSAAAVPVTDPQLEQALIAAHRALIAAFENRDVEGFVALLDTSDHTLIFHPMMENRFDGRQKIRERLTAMFADMDDIRWTDVHPTLMIEGDLAWMTSELLVTWSSTTEPFVGRGTEIWILRDGSWRLLHGHWSKHAKLADS